MKQTLKTSENHFKNGYVILSYTTLQSILKSNTRKKCSVAFIWDVFVKDVSIDLHTFP